MGELTPRGNVDAFHMVLAKDHKGWVVGKGGVRVVLKVVNQRRPNSAFHAYYRWPDKCDRRNYYQGF